MATKFDSVSSNPISDPALLAKLSIMVYRRTRAEIEVLEDNLLRIAEESQPLTIRHLFYRMVAAGLIEKTEAEYHNVVIRLATKLRMNNILPFSWIVDNTRFVHRPKTYDSVELALQESIRAYRKNLWNDQNTRVEIWCEKDAIRALILPETWDYDVPLYICRGHSSVSFIHSAWEEIELEQKETYLYLLTDFDKSGYKIDNNIRKKLTHFSKNRVPIHFERLAVTEEQIDTLNLPTRPAKEKTGGFTRNVELDAMKPLYLKMLVRTAIEKQMPSEELSRLKEIESAERETFQKVYEQFKKGK